MNNKISLRMMTLGLLLIPLLVFAKTSSAANGEKMKDTKIFITHGYMATPAAHWFPWLKKQIEKDGGEAFILNMPDSNNPKVESWNEQLKKEITVFNEHTYLIAHSLGCITTLNFLSTLPETTRLGGLICVSGFSESLPTIPSLNEFTAKKYDIKKVKKILPQRVVIVANDDKIVSHEITERLAKELDAPLHRVEKGGHFLDSDGFKEFPLVLTELKKMIERK